MRTERNRRRAWLAAVAAWLALHGGAALAQGAGENAQASPWKIVCGDETVAEPGDDAAGCRMAQTIVTNESTEPVLLVRVFPGDSPTVVASVPLGVLLKAGLTVTIDGGAPLRHRYEVCNAEGCHVGIPLDPSLLRRLQRGNEARFGLVDGSRQPIELPISLAGFTAGWKALNERAEANGSADR